MAEFKSEDEDYIRVMSNYGPTLSRCSGGRLQVRGYICPHCDSDDTSDCQAPKPGYSNG